MSRKREPLGGSVPLALSVASVARLLDMSDSAVRGAISRGDLAAVRVGNLVRVPISELVRLGLDISSLKKGLPAGPLGVRKPH